MIVEGTRLWMRIKGIYYSWHRREQTLHFHVNTPFSQVPRVIWSGSDGCCTCSRNLGLKYFPVGTDPAWTLPHRETLSLSPKAVCYTNIFYNISCAFLLLARQAEMVGIQGGLPLNIDSLKYFISLGTLVLLVSNFQAFTRRQIFFLSYKKNIESQRDSHDCTYESYLFRVIKDLCIKKKSSGVFIANEYCIHFLMWRKKHKDVRKVET